MFSLPRTFEILLFAFVNFAPYVILSVYAFYKQMRFSKWITWGACSVLLLIQFSTRYWSAMNNISLSITMSIIRLIIFLIIYAVLFDVRFRKILFIELVFANIGNFIIIASVCLERNLFPTIDHHLYCWHCSLTMVFLHLILTIPMALMIKTHFKSMIENKFVGNQWYYYWMVPAIFYVIWQYQIHGGTETGLDIILNPSNVVFLFIINIGAFLIYLIMIHLDSQLAHNLELEEKNHYQDVALLEYQLIEERIEDARRARHDIRHHMVVLGEYLDAEDYEHLKEYLNHYRRTFSNDQTITFCPHRTINSIILYFAHQAKEKNIDFQVQLSIPEQLSVKDTDIAVVLGNLLENALDASEEYDGHRRIIIRGNADQHALAFTIDNTCSTSIKTNQQGQLLSTKKKGSGIGVKSVQHIVNQYNGVFAAEKKGEMFYVSFMLNF